MTILVAEQNSNIALRYAHRVYVLETGKVVLDGVAAELRKRDDIKAFYLGRTEHLGPAETATDRTGKDHTEDEMTGA